MYSSIILEILNIFTTHKDSSIAFVCVCVCVCVCVAVDAILDSSLGDILSKFFLLTGAVKTQKLMGAPFLFELVAVVS